MKTDNQHLEYLISQYVDGCLDGASKKSLEQKFVNDPVSRQLYKEQREVQDVLDDWGSRIPLINWNDFDKKLATRLEHEVVGGGKISIFRRWARPMSAAAALFVAASVGYAWHAWSVAPQLNNGGKVVQQDLVAPSAPVEIDGMRPAATASRSTVVINEASAPTTVGGNVAIVLPDDVEASRALRAALEYGMEGVTPTVAKIAGPTGNNTRGAASAMHNVPEEKEPAEKEPAGFP